MRVQIARLPEPYRLPLGDTDDRYADREAAGRDLATLLQRYRGGRAIVLALPPGGVVVAGALARALRLPLDVLIAREFAIQPYPTIVAGALSEGGGLCVNAALLRLPGASFAGIWRAAHRVRREIEALIVAYRPGRARLSLGRRPVILVDDGLSNGLLQLAALAALHHAHPQRCIVATPFGTPAALGRVARMADDLVTPTHVTSERWDGRAHWQHTLSDAAAVAVLHRWQMAAAILDRGRATRNADTISIGNSITTLTLATVLGALIGARRVPQANRVDRARHERLISMSALICDVFSLFFT